MGIYSPSKNPPSSSDKVRFIKVVHNIRLYKKCKLEVFVIIHRKTRELTAKNRFQLCDFNRVIIKHLIKINHEKVKKTYVLSQKISNYKSRLSNFSCALFLL